MTSDLRSPGNKQAIGQKSRAMLLPNIISCLILFACPALAFSQVDTIPVVDPVAKEFIPLTVDSSRKIAIGNIYITGNKRTKTYIILREIQFKSGDSMPAWQFRRQMLRAQYQVYNTTLFSEVTVLHDSSKPDRPDIHVAVKEKWYIYPTPQFQLVDRNFNEWIKVYKADLDRVIYGIKFAHYNFSGRRDQLRVFLLNGYARHISIAYQAPYSNRALTEGFGVAAAFTQNREIPYKTSYGNKLLQYKNGAFVRTSLAFGGTYFSRKGFFKTHAYSVNYYHNQVADTIIKTLNPSYFNKKDSAAGYPEISYVFQYANTNNIKFPLTGLVWGLALSKRGVGFEGGMNMFTLEGLYSRHIGHGRKWYSNFHLQSKLKLPFRQPYINQRALGYGELYLRGLEYYVVDGVATTLGKYTLRKKILSFNLPIPFKIKMLPSIPFNFYGKTYADAGYVYNRKELDTRLNNRFLYTGGFGVDVLTLYDINVSVEYSFNQLGEKGLFLHLKGGF